MYAPFIFLSLFVMNSAVSAEPKLEQVTITATRTDTSGEELPLTWTLVNQEQINITNSTHITEIMQKVPGAWISRGNGQESLVSIRSPVLTGSGACGAYLVTWDEIPLRATGFCNVNQLFDLNFEQASKIEVIKGPAPSSFG
ncbi:MAG: Plug domain-containing protein [Halieaceae bacterium]|nr:Plug domain-containing protein [Halieaceae bacterium]